MDPTILIIIGSVLGVCIISGILINCIFKSENK